MSKHINIVSPAQIIKIQLPAARTWAELVEYAAKQFKQELKSIPDAIPGAHRVIRTLGINPKQAVYEAYYVTNEATH